MVLPVQHALQGHPESGDLSEKFVNKVIARHGFKSTTHKRSIYDGSYKGHHMLICRQVDDLAIGCIDPKITRVMTFVMKVSSNSFNGVDVEQTNRYVKITCESYIDKLLTHYGWAAAGAWDTDSKPIEPLASLNLQQMFVPGHTGPSKRARLVPGGSYPPIEDIHSRSNSPTELLSVVFASRDNLRYHHKCRTPVGYEQTPRTYLPLQ